MKRSAEMILKEISPFATGKRYDEKWNHFCDYVDLKDKKPTEEDFIRFFDHLKKEKNYASSTMWTVYSMLNNKMQLLFGEKLQIYPRLTLLLKSYEVGYVRKTAGQFSKEQIMNFLANAPDNGEFVHVKAGVVLSYFGGLRCADLISITCDDMEFNEETGMWVTYVVSKQKGEEIKNKFNVPLEFCGYLEKYDHALSECKMGEGRIFKTYRKKQNGNGYYVNQPMGKHLLSKFPSKVAMFLDLPNPSGYTGHAFRRTAANVMAEGGASSSVMKKHFNWKSENTSQKYVENTDNAKLCISKIMKPNSDGKKTGNSDKDHATSQTSQVIQLKNCQNIVINM